MMPKSQLFRSLRFVVLFIAAGSFVAHRASAAEKPAIVFSTNDCLVDEVVGVEVVGLKPQQDAILRAAMIDTQGRRWTSFGVFTADAAGRVDLRKHAPKDGTYTGHDPMGLIWSMKLEVPPDDGKPQGFRFDIDNPLVTSFELQLDGASVATAELKRFFRSPGVKEIDVKVDGMVGKLYIPAGDGPFPGVMVLSGSEGGINRLDGQLLASRGFAAFSLAYFNAEGLPQQLVNIPLEYFRKGLDWFMQQPGVDRSRIAATGGSRGGELALLLGASFPEIRAVVAYVPSHVVWQGVSWSGPPPDASTWASDGKGLPYLRGKPGPAFYSQFGSGKPMELISLFEGGLEDVEAMEKAAIPVEKIRGPVLLISGREDRMWPSTRMSDLVIERLRKNNHPYKFTHLAYDGAGHAIRKAYLPAAGTLATDAFGLGGTMEGNARAQADSWPKVLQFLRESLK